LIIYGSVLAQHPFSIQNIDLGSGPDNFFVMKKKIRWWIYIIDADE